MKVKTMEAIFPKIALTVMLLVSSCTVLPGFQTPQPIVTEPSTVRQLKLAEIVFQVDIPMETKPEEVIYVDILDEITGLAINPKRYLLEQIDDYRFATRLPLPIGSVIKYRYGKDGNPPSIEFTSAGKQVRYRMLRVTGPMVAEDIVSAWTDLQFKGKIGRISGQVLDSKTGLPVPNMMVTAGGMQTFTASNGSFILEGLPTGTHRIVAYNLDGLYEPFQQGARVAAGSDTPAIMKVVSTTTVKVTFSVKAPKEGIQGIPIRLIGNIYSLGNTFADLNGGFSTIAARAPLLTLSQDGSYSLTIDLPVGLDLRYKYSLGDGFWNSEHTPSGDFNVRQLIVPDKPVRIIDTIESWQEPNTSPVTFSVKVPSNTPPTDSVSIQFNPFGWTVPLPMWPLGNNQWMYVLYSPLSMVGSVGYRYCRNDQCGVADDDAIKGENAQGMIISLGRVPQNIQDEVKKWSWWISSPSPATVITPDINGRGRDFIAGVEFSQNYQTTWQSKWNQSFQNIKELNANWLTFTPTWSITRQNPPVIEPLPGRDQFWQDHLQMTGWAKENGFKYAIFPLINLPDPAWWNATPRDTNWWQTWFDRYEAFLVNFADLATQTNASALILGDENVMPAITGLLPNGKSAGAPADLVTRWNKILASLRFHYEGQIIWAISFPNGTKSIPQVVDKTDALYVLWAPHINLSSNANEAEMVKEISRIFDQELVKVKEVVKKPMIVGVDYASFDNAVKGCITIGTSCQSISILSQPSTDNPLVELDLLEQASLYNAFLTVINSRKWIDGFISRGYYPPVSLQDKSSSVNGKPASDILWYWYPRLLANP